ncbi:MAG: hypothetical protein ACOY3P_05025, partial [Planctomycetota bacterium]
MMTNPMQKRVARRLAVLIAAILFVPMADRLAGGEAETPPASAVVPNFAALRALKVRHGSPAAATALAHTTEGDGGGGMFLWNDASEAPDDDGMTLIPDGHDGPGRWLRQTDHTEPRAAWWG